MTEQVKQMLDDLGDWRGTRALYIRELILKADSDLSEQIKWNSPVFIKKKNICSIGIFKDHIKLNFFDGANLEDPEKIFNAGLDAKKSRGIDLTEKDSINENAFIRLVQSATT
jgi:hypothetical protein